MAKETQDTLNMLSNALEMEKNGFRFYEKAAAESRNPLGRRIFTMLRDDEILHMKRIRTIYDHLQENHDWDVEWRHLEEDRPDAEEMIREFLPSDSDAVTADADDLDALTVGIDLESRAVRFYQKRLDAAGGTLEREFLEAMVEEEERHHKLLQDMKHFLEGPDVGIILG